MKKLNFDRRIFVQGSLSLLGTEVLFSGCTQSRRIPGLLYGPNSTSGHLLRGENASKAPATSKTIETVIIGGGVAGLSAARALTKLGRSDFLLLELEDQVGGNSRYGTSGDKKFPWGAHYLPLPLPHWKELIQFLEESSVISARNKDGSPVYREEYLCHEPQERLLIYGHWQSGMHPHFAESEEDRRQFKAFNNSVQQIRNLRSPDGLRYFDFPLSQCSTEGFAKYDQMTMREWLDQQQLDSKYLRWYINYCCKDDYASEIDEVSAWAGLHYFASRTENTSQLDSAVLTWPEGNGFLVDKLRAQISSEKIQSQALVYSVVANQDYVEVEYFDLTNDTKHIVKAKNAILAVPSHVRSKVLKQAEYIAASHSPKSTHAPWVTASVYLNELPETKGSGMAWDNVCYHSKSLGYIFSDHQSLSQPQPPYILTYYAALTGDPVVERAMAGLMTLSDWQRKIVADLSKMHPGIEASIERLDVWVWGHGMIRPTPSLLSENRKRPAQLGSIYFAHSDDGGISVFEEAFYRGLHAAESIAKKIKGAHA